MRNYAYNEELGILIIRVEGDIGANDIIDHYIQLSSYSKLTQNLKVLIDCSYVKFQIKPGDINFAQVTLPKAISAFSDVREAIMVSQPYATVVATLFQQLGKRFDNYSFQVFYTEEAATNWLLRI